MPWELEGLIAGLLVVISCSGEQGELQLNFDIFFLVDYPWHLKLPVRKHHHEGHIVSRHHFD